MKSKSILLSIIAALCLFPILSEVLAAPSWQQPPGTLFDLGDHRLHLYCAGTATPTVVIDAGLGASSVEWLPIVDRIASHQRTCVYDRAGYGWSDPGPTPRTSARIADELENLLRAADLPAPYVLVGHSFGGLNMQLFAGRYGEETAGLVLVDASHPQQASRFAKPPLSLNTAPKNRRGQPVFSDIHVPRELPTELQNVAMVFMMMPKTRNVIGDEYVAMRQSAREVAAVRTPPDLPLLVISRAERPAASDPRGALIDKVWLELQSELATRSRFSAHVQATHSGHNIHLEQPQLVADGITLIVDVWRQTRSSAAPRLEPHWLAFKDAVWLKDDLPDQQAMDPSLRGRLAQNTVATLGRIAAPTIYTYTR